MSSSLAGLRTLVAVLRLRFVGQQIGEASVEFQAGQEGRRDGRPRCRSSTDSRGCVTHADLPCVGLGGPGWRATAASWDGSCSFVDDRVCWAGVGVRKPDESERGDGLLEEVVPDLAEVDHAIKSRVAEPSRTKRFGCRARVEQHLRTDQERGDAVLGEQVERAPEEELGRAAVAKRQRAFLGPDLGCGLASSERLAPGWVADDDGERARRPRQASRRIVAGD